MLAPEDREARRHRYVEAVWRIAERDGVERASMRAIAAEAGTSLGMLQHHFADKDDLLAAAVWSRMASKHRQLDRALHRLGADPDVAAVLAVALRHRLPLTPKLRTEARVLQHWLAGEAQTPLKLDVLLDSDEVLADAVRSALGAAQLQGRIDPGVPVDVLTAALVALNGGLMQGLMIGRHSPTQATDIIETTIGALLGPPSPAAQRNAANRER